MLLVICKDWVRKSYVFPVFFWGSSNTLVKVFSIILNMTSCTCDILYIYMLSWRHCLWFYLNLTSIALSVLFILSISSCSLGMGTIGGMTVYRTSKIEVSAIQTLLSQRERRSNVICLWSIIHQWQIQTK